MRRGTLAAFGLAVLLAACQTTGTSGFGGSGGTGGTSGGFGGSGGSGGSSGGFGGSGGSAGGAGGAETLRLARQVCVKAVQDRGDRVRKVDSVREAPGGADVAMRVRSGGEVHRMRCHYTAGNGTARLERV